MTSPGAYRRIRLTSPDLALRGQIFYALMDEPKTTSDLALELELKLSVLRLNLIRMHQLDHIEPFDVNEHEPEGAVGYYRDLVWMLTDHARHHHEMAVGCRGCTTRRILAASAEVFYE